MHKQSPSLDTRSFREQLMAPQPMQRALALHALAMQAELPDPPTALATAAQRFAARGIPYYQQQDPHFNEWVGRAVSYWERLHRPDTAKA